MLWIIALPCRVVLLGGGGSSNNVERYFRTCRRVVWIIKPAYSAVAIVATTLSSLLLVTFAIVATTLSPLLLVIFAIVAYVADSRTTGIDAETSVTTRAAEVASWQLKQECRNIDAKYGLSAPDADSINHQATIHRAAEVASWQLKQECRNIDAKYGLSAPDADSINHQATIHRAAEVASWQLKREYERLCFRSAVRLVSIVGDLHRVCYLGGQEITGVREDVRAAILMGTINYIARAAGCIAWDACLSLRGADPSATLNGVLLTPQARQGRSAGGSRAGLYSRIVNDLRWRGSRSTEELCSGIARALVLTAWDLCKARHPEQDIAGVREDVRAVILMGTINYIVSSATNIAWDACLSLRGADPSAALDDVLLLAWQTREIACRYERLCSGIARALVLTAWDLCKARHPEQEITGVREDVRAAILMGTINYIARAAGCIAWDACLSLRGADPSATLNGVLLTPQARQGRSAGGSRAGLYSRIVNDLRRRGSRSTEELCSGIARALVLTAWDLCKARHPEQDIAGVREDVRAAILMGTINHIASSAGCIAWDACLSLRGAGPSATLDDILFAPAQQAQGAAL
ncbi:hypothetical protein [Anaplasma marginale]